MQIYVNPRKNPAGAAAGRIITCLRNLLHHKNHARKITYAIMLPGEADETPCLRANNREKWHVGIDAFSTAVHFMFTKIASMNGATSWGISVMAAHWLCLIASCIVIG